MKKLILFFLTASVMCFAGTMNINFNNGTPTEQIDFSAIDNVQVFTPPERMVFVQGGTFDMGDHYSEGYSYELPVHSVILSNYFIGKYEVTQAEWSQYMPAESWNSTYGVGDTYPAYYVSWYETIKYCNLRSMAEGLNPCYTISSSTDPAAWGSVPTNSNSTWNAVLCNWDADGYRLPTEAEWEYASRGGIHWSDNYRYSGCSLEAELLDYAWYLVNSGVKTHPVGEKLPNQLELYDMTGNLGEFCWDRGSETYYTDCYNIGTVTDPHGPDTGTDRLWRGGYLNVNAIECRTAYRTWGWPYVNYSAGVGFRVVRKY